MIDICIERPFAIGGEPCPRVAAWLLAALALASRNGGPGLVEAGAVAGRLRSKAGLSMALSRSFAHYARHGVAVGWGPHTGCDPATLPLHGRARGPFWLAPSMAARLRFVGALGGAVEASVLAGFVGAPLEPAADAPVPGLELDAWHGLIDARQRIEESLYEPGRGRADAVPALLDIGLGARAPLARQWALFFAAQHARRHGDVAGARRLLTSAIEADDGAGGARDEAIRLLCRIGLAWCAYQEREFAAVQAALDELGRHPGRMAANPRLACEFHNLRALWRRATLEPAPTEPARAAARAILADLQTALACALEADAFALLESVASNLGYSLWLLEPCLPAGVAEAGARLEAIRWILLGDWLCQRHGLAGGSAWNLISVCRVARGAGRAPATGRAGAAPGHARLSLAQVREAAGHTAASLGSPRQVRDWIDLTAMLAATASREGGGLPALQRCAAWIEHAWCVAQAGAPGLPALLAHVEAALPELVPGDRRFFRAELRALRRLPD